MTRVDSLGERCLLLNTFFIPIIFRKTRPNDELLAEIKKTLKRLRHVARPTEAALAHLSNQIKQELFRNESACDKLFIFTKLSCRYVFA